MLATPRMLSWLPAALLACTVAGPLRGYSVLTHEAIIDAAWSQKIEPLLRKRFPQTTPDGMRDAHAYAYGGCILQDMGYYPFGSKFFSNLVHYVHSGDFVLKMIADSQDVNEYAFALGALAHYAADTVGHPVAVNVAVPIEYPKLERKFGHQMTYEDNPAAHIKTEFGFDVAEVAQGNYAPQAYHDFIGFSVSKPLLERAFHDTYGLELKDVFLNVDLALGTYRRTVSGLIPEATRIAWVLEKKDLRRARPGTTRRKFTYNLSRSSYEKEWGHEYQKPGIGARFLAWLFRLIPKIGPFQGLAIKPPTARTQKLFMESFNRALDMYRNLLSQVDAGRLRLENRNFDTGELSRPGEYKLADETAAELARRLQKTAQKAAP
jgi:hypothetical protein